MRNGPLAELSDAEILRRVAMELQQRARAEAAPMAERMRDAAGRLRAIARRVPLWTDRTAPRR